MHFATANNPYRGMHCAERTRPNAERSLHGDRSCNRTTQTRNAQRGCAYRALSRSANCMECTARQRRPQTAER